MQASALAVAALVYAGAALQTWRTLPGAVAMKLDRLVLGPGVLATLALLAALLIPVLRTVLIRHLWVSYRTGFGQSVVSVLAGLGLLIAVAGFSLWPFAHGAFGSPAAGAGYSAYAAGIGVLLAEAFLVRRIEADPVLRREIEVG